MPTTAFEIVGDPQEGPHMRRIATSALALLAVAALAAPASATSPVVVGGADGWVSTGIHVDAGEHVSVMTLGQVLTAPIPNFHIPGVFKSASGPAGQDTQPDLRRHVRHVLRRAEGGHRAVRARRRVLR